MDSLLPCESCEQTRDLPRTSAVMGRRMLTRCDGCGETRYCGAHRQPQPPATISVNACQVDFEAMGPEGRAAFAELIAAVAKRIEAGWRP